MCVAWEKEEEMGIRKEGMENALEDTRSLWTAMVRNNALDFA